MVRGLDLFQQHFANHMDHYVLIGGSACSLAFDAANLEFRATKDLDLVLTLEVLNDDFAKRLWQFVREGQYSTYQRSKEKDAFYRFHSPADRRFPQMLELFARNPGLKLVEGSHLTPIIWEQVDDADAKSLSAILMNDAYYKLIHDNKIVQGGIMTLGAPQLVPLKARAWLDMIERRDSGIHVDDKELKKHRNDIVRLHGILDAEMRIELEDSIKADMINVLERLLGEDIEPKHLGSQRPLEAIVADLQGIYLPK
jgi:hypothetical protein